MPDKAGASRYPQRFLAAFARWFRLVGLCVVIGAAGAFVMTAIQTPIYRATAILFIGQQSASVPLVDAQLVTTYAQLINQPVVLNAAARQVGGIAPDDLAKHLQVSAESNTSLLDVSVDDPDANRAARLSNAVAGAFISQISGQVVTAGYPVVIFQPAVAPTTPDHPKPLLNTLIGGTFGLAVAIILVQLLDVLDTRTRAAQPADNRVYPNSNQKDNSTDLADVKTKAE